MAWKMVRKVVALVAVLVLLFSTTLITLASHSNTGPSRAVSYINPDLGAATENPDVNRDSSCSSPDRSDTQQLSDAGATNRNVHNDACFFSGYRSDTKVDAPATYESKGVGFINACPDPDGTGPKVAVLSDTNGDGRNDRCFQSGYQQKGTAGDLEFHARLNNSTTAGDQYVVWCYDPNKNGCADEDVKDQITIKWVTTAPAPAPTNPPSRAVSYINPDLGAATENADVNRDSSCANPDRYDQQKLSDAGTTNRNVHNDACFFSGYRNDTKVDGPATYESKGVGFISACPDPDGAGPKVAVLSDTNGDGRNDRCFQSGYQQKGTAGDLEFHARLNNSTTAGEQYVVWCYDPNQNGCADEYIKDQITIKWVP